MEKQQLLKKIGKEMRKLRRERGLTLFDLEAMTDISKKQLLKIEQGKANLTTYSLYKLAISLEMDIEKVFNVN